MLPAQTNKFAFLFGPVFKLTLAVILGVLMAWTINIFNTRLDPIEQEQAFQSKLAECERLAELNGNDWRLKLGLDDSCVAVFEEYSRRIDEAAAQESARQESPPQGVSDGTTPEPPDTEY